MDWNKQINDFKLQLSLKESQYPFATPLLRLVDTILAKIGQIEKMEGPAGERGEVGPAGERGPQGEPGPQGLPGKDGKPGPKGDRGPAGTPGKNGRDGKDGKDGRNGINGVNGLDGKDGSPDTPKQIVKKLESLQDDDRLPASAIKDIPTVVRELPQFFFGGGGRTPLTVDGAGQDIRRLIFSGATVERVGDGVARITAQADESTLVTSVTGTTTITSTTGLVVVLADATTGNIIVNIPTAIGNTARITVKKTDSSTNTVVLTATGGQTIDGSAIATITKQYESVDIVTDNANWFII